MMWNMASIVCVKLFDQCVIMWFLPIIGASRGEIVIVAEEVQDSKYSISMQLSAGHLDKKDFFGKVDTTLTASFLTDKAGVVCLCVCVCAHAGFHTALFVRGRG